MCNNTYWLANYPHYYKFCINLFVNSNQDGVRFWRLNISLSKSILRLIFEMKNKV